MRDHMMGWTGLIEQQPWTPRRTPARAPTVSQAHLDVPPDVGITNDVKQGLMLWTDGRPVKHFGAPLAPWLLRLIEARGGKLVFSREPVTVSTDGGGGDDTYTINSSATKEEAAKEFAALHLTKYSLTAVTLDDIKRAITSYRDGAKSHAEAAKNCRDVLHSLGYSGFAQLQPSRYAQAMQMIRDLPPC